VVTHSVVFLAPHYDDAVLSCGASIAGLPGSLVITVFSGAPAPGDPISVWDRECGFERGDDVAATREREDRGALALLGAQGSGLGLMPAQYRIPSRLGRARLAALATRLHLGGEERSDLQQAVTAALSGALRAKQPATCIMPLGVSHPDHVLTAGSALSLIDAFPACRWLAYTDLPYAAENTVAHDRARERAQNVGYELKPTVLAGHPEPELKKRAVERYASQVRGLGGRVAIALSAPERYYELSPRCAQPLA
jgi:LmbE family N-acetylglucosaminyl deacetylase